MRLLHIENNHPRVLTYINIRLIKLSFSLRKDVFNHRDINIISFFNCSIMCFIINVYLDDQQSALKYIKNTKVNLNNVLIIIGDLSIRDNNWNLSYSHYLTHVDTLRETANSFYLELLLPIDQVYT